MASIDTASNLIIPLDGGYEIFIPQPSKYEVMAISKVLGYFYKQITQGESVDVIVVDWERLVDEALEASLNSHNLKEATLAFLEKTMFSSWIHFEDGRTVSYNEAHLTVDKVEYFKGTILFICALCRYASSEVKKIALKGFITSQNLEAWKSSLLTSSRESEEDQDKTELNSRPHKKKRREEKPQVRLS